MKKIMKKVVFSLLIFILCSASVFAAENNITKEYTFKAKDPDNLEYKYEKTISEGLKEYKAAGVIYRVIKDNRAQIKKNFAADTLAPKEIKEKNIVYKLKEKSKKEKTIKKITVSSDINISDEIIENGEVLKLRAKENKTAVEQVNLPARFYGEESSNIYKFNGKYITLLDNNNPVWNGFNSDVKGQLKLGNEYNILSGRFTTGYITSNGVTYRDAIYTVNRNTNVVEATYESLDEYIYVEDAKKVEAKAIVTYEIYSDYTKYIYAAAVIAVFAVAISLILFIIKKRRKNENKGA